MLTAITRAVSPSLNRCELTFLDRQEIDVARAIAQHRCYRDCLVELGLAVLTLPAEPALPDSVFVEDPAVVVDEVAVILRMGAESRRPESESLARALAPYRPLRRLREPATLEGGDVVRVDRRIFVGLSGRTNQAGIEQLSAELEPLGYTVSAVEMRGCLHLKSACCGLPGGRLLANPEWVDTAAFAGLDIVSVAPDEPAAADVLAIGDTVLIPAAFPATAARLAGLGLQVIPLDVSELLKAEAGVTCMSVVFTA
ncbi:MAG TPA: arginine deiminase family protein [Bryobacteraceae bacterium]|nr:arginine deiminase family protein [Bryobacteraceae bacterium]